MKTRDNLKDIEKDLNEILDRPEDLIPDGPTPDEMIGPKDAAKACPEDLPGEHPLEGPPERGARVIHIPTSRKGTVIGYHNAYVVVQFPGEKENTFDQEEILYGDLAIAPEQPKADRVKRVIDDLIEGFAKLTAQAGANLLTVAVVNEMIGVRKALTRLADVGELVAVLQAQQSVPRDVAAKLNPWRDDLLQSMTKRAERRLKRAERIAKKKRKPYSPPTVTKQVPSRDVTI